MLGPVGPALKAVLTRAGYDLYRPTTFEQTVMRSPFADWFGKDIGLFAEVYDANRKTLAKVPRWVEPEALIGSLWRYGVPEQWDSGPRGLGETGLNEIEAEPTYSDLIAFMARKLPDLRYLEIGVSVGKNFLQVVENVPGQFTGLDVERINPVMERALGGDFTEHRTGTVQRVETLSGEVAAIGLATYTKDNVTYLRGDQFADETWATLKQPFNFIFSDGVHSARAVVAEMDFLLKHRLIDTSGPFVMYWDDLVNVEMQTAFDECVSRLAGLFPSYRHGLHWIHGTYGAKRLNGMFVAGL